MLVGPSLGIEILMCDPTHLLPSLSYSCPLTPVSPVYLLDSSRDIYDYQYQPLWQCQEREPSVSRSEDGRGD